MKLKYIILCVILQLSISSVLFATEIDLSGIWDYCIINSNNDYPPREETDWKKIKLPNRNLFSEIAKIEKITKGYILYRKKLILKDNASPHLVFQAGEIMNSDMVYINGRKIGETGIFPPYFRSGWSKFRHYPIPDGSLKRGENLIDVVCYFDSELWFLSPIRIIDEGPGNMDYMFRNFIQIDFIHAFYFILLSFSIFFIAIFIKRKKEIVYLYYACLTFFLADMMILQFVENLYSYLPLSSNTIYKICGIGVMFLPPFLAFFFRSYLGFIVTRKRLFLYLLLPCVFTVLMLLSSDRYYIVKWRNIFLILVPLYIADIVLTSIRQLISGNRKGLVLFIALIPIFIFGVYDILVFSLHLFEGDVPLYPLGVPFIAILIGVQLVNRFISNLNAAEELNFLLQEKMEEGKRLARLENEITIARNIQLANVPKNLPELSSFKIATKYIPAENISGDFYNFHAAEKDRLGVLVADVSGHGIPASLISSMVKILFSTLASVYSNPQQFLIGLNNYLYDKMEGNFLTAGYCYIDKKDKKALYARAGHEPLIHISRKEGRVELHEYKPRGRIIGVTKEIHFDVSEFSINEGDRIVLYTDGFIEAFNESNEFFGRGRLKSLLLETVNLTADKVIEFAYSTLQEWCSQKPVDDDLTIIIIDIM